ncbi:hypothetical protein F442_09911 [Phytophthora nicotianae P10297]|uniref:Uncharacterized protein n=4 Tax=Phytophthora nicotianae TaxID=4792 RepID=V9F1M9_PHYNI|nr:hypothetical protein F443_10011 [Phytophthora nicotianae P1569]ETL91899.1 hypothetical protein L917_09635 [Phytophthora nicotianae]ETM45194.1 hypothetical protein L914_09681 [Phytophthora nicotianae]ETP43286.1 hypothetical protein F442_09911 [Phytophthora nicotianae P10297]
MAPRRSGGSQTTIPLRRPRKVHDRDEAACLRAVAKLGPETTKQLRADWDSWDTGYGGKEWSQSEGVVMLPTRFSSNGELYFTNILLHLQRVTPPITSLK